MLEESLRRRLEALNRGALPPAKPRPTAARRASGSSRARPASPVGPEPEGLLQRGRVTNTPYGEHLTISASVEDYWPQAAGLIHARHEQLLLTADPTCDDARSHFVRALPGRFVGLDLETCGLSGSALFLVGVVRECEGALRVELLLARNYAEEAAVLWSLGERLAAADTLVTFNGKSFDWPMVTDRWHRHLLSRKSPLPQLAHYDVLHHARRRWRGALPDCKLQTIERMICRRGRTGDIPGHLIPSAYDHYVRTGASSEMDQVLHHNLLDLVTLLDVAMRLAGD